MSLLAQLQRTKPYHWPILFRLLAGVPLVVFSVMHFLDPDHFRAILQAAGFPLVELNVYLASAAEFAGGVLLLLGLYARLGGLLGVATMLPAIYTTVKFMGVADAPKIPYLPVPIMVLLASAVVVLRGGGILSLDHAMSRER